MTFTRKGVVLRQAHIKNRSLSGRFKPNAAPMQFNNFFRHRQTNACIFRLGIKRFKKRKNMIRIKFFNTGPIVLNFNHPFCFQILTG